MIIQVPQDHQDLVQEKAHSFSRNEVAMEVPLAQDLVVQDLGQLEIVPLSNINEAVMVVPQAQDLAVQVQGRLEIVHSSNRNEVAMEVPQAQDQDLVQAQEKAHSPNKNEVAMAVHQALDLAVQGQLVPVHLERVHEQID